MKKNFTCFLIDDDIDDQEIFLSVVQDVAPPVRCYTASNGQEGISKLASGAVKPDLIFLDLNMPLMNGKQFLEECHHLDECRHIPVVILTTSSDKRSMEEARELGARDFVTKPDKFSDWNVVIKAKINAYREHQQ